MAHARESGGDAGILAGSISTRDRLPERQLLTSRWCSSGTWSPNVANPLPRQARSPPNVRGEGILTITRADAGMECSGRWCGREDGLPAMLNSAAAGDAARCGSVSDEACRAAAFPASLPVSPQVCSYFAPRTQMFRQEPMLKQH